MNIDKKHIFPFIVSCYIVASLAYIGYDAWSDFKLQYAEQAYASGREATIQQLVTQASDPTCQPFPVYAGDTQVQLINTACLTVTETTDETQTTQ